MIEPKNNPIELFNDWFSKAADIGLKYPHAMTLATVGEDGLPDARIVLLKGHDDRGFVFFTNTMSRKGAQLAENPGAALCFYWQPLDRQIRIRGSVEPVSQAESDAYFATRPRNSRIGAWASLQSEPLSSRDDLMERFREVEEKYPDETIPRPPHWSGYRVVPQIMEFWQEGDFRLHHRLRYQRSGKEWRTTLLYP